VGEEGEKGTRTYGQRKANGYPIEQKYPDRFSRSALLTGIAGPTFDLVALTSSIPARVRLALTIDNLQVAEESVTKVAHGCALVMMNVQYCCAIACMACMAHEVSRCY
jgi:hypothetical protein